MLSKLFKPLQPLKIETELFSWIEWLCLIAFFLACIILLILHIRWIVHSSPTAWISFLQHLCSLIFGAIISPVIVAQILRKKELRECDSGGHSDGLARQ